MVAAPEPPQRPLREVALQRPRDEAAVAVNGPLAQHVEEPRPVRRGVNRHVFKRHVRAAAQLHRAGVGLASLLPAAEDGDVAHVAAPVETAGDAVGALAGLLHGDAVAEAHGVLEQERLAVVALDRPGVPDFRRGLGRRARIAVKDPHRPFALRANLLDPPLREGKLGVVDRHVPHRDGGAVFKGEHLRADGADEFCAAEVDFDVAEALQAQADRFAVGRGDAVAPSGNDDPPLPLRDGGPHGCEGVRPGAVSQRGSRRNSRPKRNRPHRGRRRPRQEICHLHVRTLLISAA